MLTKCIHCGFNIRQTEEFCFDCGLKEPLTKLQKYDVTIRTAITITLLFIPVITVTFLLASKSSIEVLLAFSILAYFISIIPIYNYFLKIQNQEIARRFSELGLTQKQILIDNRLADLKKRNGRLTTILDKIGDSTNKNLQEIKPKLLSANKIIISQFVRYELQRKKIELVRLQNKMLPYLENINDLQDFQAENGIVESENVIQEITEINQNLSKEFPVSFHEERQIFLNQLQETSVSCETLREGLLSKQAVRALQSVQPIENIDNPNYTKDISHSIETFNIQTTLTDFSESFEQLENEYRRLLADNEVSEKLLNYEN